MRAVVLERFGAPARVAVVPDPSCPRDGVVVRVRATGLCRSDWHAWAGHDDDVVLPHVPGHEFAGVVEQVGAGLAEARDRPEWLGPGARVTAPFVMACGTCARCRSGDHQVCERQTQPGFSYPGSFAERVVVDRAAVNLVPLPAGVDDDAAAALGCRFATAFRAVVDVGSVRAGDAVAVHGAGGVGLSAVMVARACGARVVAVDVRPGPLELAVRHGADAVVDARGLTGPDAVADAVRQAAGRPGGVDLSLDALGSEATCAASVASLRPRGRHVQVGLLPPGLGLPRVPMHLVVARELQVLGSHGMAAHHYPALLALVASGRLDPAALVTRRIRLDDVPAALAAMGEQAAAGVVMAHPSADPSAGAPGPNQG